MRKLVVGFRKNYNSPAFRNHFLPSLFPHDFASISGGAGNQATGISSSLSGGELNLASVLNAATPNVVQTWPTSSGSGSLEAARGSLHVVDANGVVKRITVGRHVQTALAGVDLRVRRGEFSLVLGRSGSGKTTLLTILGGLLTQDEGQVRVLGHNLAEMRPRDRRALIRKEVGWVFQTAGLVPSLLASENVAEPMAPLCVNAWLNACPAIPMVTDGFVTVMV